MAVGSVARVRTMRGMVEMSRMRTVGMRRGMVRSSTVLSVLELLLLEEELLLLLLHLDLHLARDKGMGLHGSADLDGETGTSDLDVLGGALKAREKAVSTSLETFSELGDREFLGL
jgi:hypothetical protein